MAMVRIKPGVIENWLKNKSTPPNTQDEVAKVCNISGAHLSYMLSGKRQPTTAVLRKLCELTGYDIGDIAFFDRNKEPESDES